jgi:hypothetical protein
MPVSIYGSIAFSFSIRSKSASDLTKQPPPSPVRQAVTGGSRRSLLRGLAKVRKRFAMAAAARNLGLLMRKMFGFGKPRVLQPEGPPGGGSSGSGTGGGGNKGSGEGPHSPDTFLRRLIRRLRDRCVSPGADYGLAAWCPVAA